jgi:hypothetical protein
MMDPHIYDLKRWHFGVTLPMNYAKFKLNTSKDFILQDSVRDIIVDGTPGIGLGGIVDLRMGEYFNLRALPSLNFHQRRLTYQFVDRKDIVDVESVTLDFPINIKYKSALHQKYVRFYAMAGARISHDFQSRSQEERGPFKKLVALNTFGAAYELGVGFDFYLPYFKFSPEIKMVNSLVNMHSPDEFIYSKAIGSIYPRMFQISFHFE